MFDNRRSNREFQKFGRNVDRMIVFTWILTVVGIILSCGVLVFAAYKIFEMLGWI